MRAPIRLRLATEADAEALLAIYAPYVRDTAITFEDTPPSLSEFRSRIGSILASYPYLVAEGEAGILGYAYASRFRARSAYDWCAEITVYIAPSAHRMGLGRLLYEKLLAILERQGVRNVYACIAWPNEPSVAFHQALGFAPVAHLNRCGYKLGQWWDTVWLERFLGRHDLPPAPLRSLAEAMAEIEWN